jgi:hypothetical protein
LPRIGQPEQSRRDETGHPQFSHDSSDARRFVLERQQEIIVGVILSRIFAGFPETRIATTIFIQPLQERKVT